MTESSRRSKPERGRMYVHCPYVTPDGSLGSAVPEKYQYSGETDCIRFQPSVLMAMRRCIHVHRCAGDPPDRLVARWILLGRIVELFCSWRGSLASELVQNTVSVRHQQEYNAVVGRRNNQRPRWNDFVCSCAPVLTLVAEDQPVGASGSPSTVFRIILACRVQGSVYLCLLSFDFEVFLLFFLGEAGFCR